MSGVLVWLLVLMLGGVLAWQMARWRVHRYLWALLTADGAQFQRDPLGVAEAVDRMTQEGYAEDFRADAGGLRDGRGTLHSVEDLRIDRFYRFGEESDPGDETMVLALRDYRTGVRGTYVVSYGTQQPPEDTAVIEKLRLAHGGDHPFVLLSATLF
jgi:hypothetical protein